MKSNCQLPSANSVSHAQVDQLPSAEIVLPPAPRIMELLEEELRGSTVHDGAYIIKVLNAKKCNIISDLTTNAKDIYIKTDVTQTPTMLISL